MRMYIVLPTRLGQWPCRACTFLNIACSTRCAICDDPCDSKTTRPPDDVPALSELYLLSLRQVTGAADSANVLRTTSDTAPTGESKSVSVSPPSVSATELDDALGSISLTLAAPPSFRPSLSVLYKRRDASDYRTAATSVSIDIPSVSRDGFVHAAEQKTPVTVSAPPERRPPEHKPPEHRPPEHRPPERRPADGGPVIYDLELTGGRRYVGRCQTAAAVPQRFKQHLAGHIPEHNGGGGGGEFAGVDGTFKGEGAAWTRRYRPLRIVSVTPEKGPGDEDEWVLRLMANPAFGIDRVRGGSFSSIDIEPHRATLVLMLQTRANMCYKCGAPGHYANACPTMPASTTSRFASRCDNPPGTPSGAASVSSRVCHERDRDNPDGASATRKRHATRVVDNETNGFEKSTGRVPFPRRYDHRQPLSRTRAEHPPHHSAKQTDNCFRCGRNTHFARDCFAATHYSDGRFL